MQPNTGVSVFGIVVLDKLAEEDLGCCSEPNRSGNTGAYFNVLNQASENGWSLLTRGRECDWATPRSASRAATVFDVRGVPVGVHHPWGAVNREDFLHQTEIACVTAGRLEASTTLRRSPCSAPASRLSDAERAEVLPVLNSPEFVDCTPLQVHALLLVWPYLCSVSSMYRVLGANARVKDRRRLARHSGRVLPEPVVTGSGEAFSWDITKLRGPVKGGYFDADVMIDTYPRYIVGACVHVTESAVLAEERALTRNRS